ncbi:MAG: DUF1573 domain-containing protein [Bacteroidota bacterium]
MKLFSVIASIALVGSLVSCKGDKKEAGVPENAINPDAMKNPASASGSADKSGVPVFQFEEETHDFGMITEGEKIQYGFKFKNVGTGDLVIRSANGSCGCTVPEWPHQPIPAGGSGVVNITFNSEGKHGMQHKTVTMISNTVPNTKVLNITGEVANADGTVEKNEEGH